MNRYFLEIAYCGTNYAGFQFQKNAVTIQAEVEKAFETYFRKKIGLTGSSRTDAGVHALQNFFHFDFEGTINSQAIYNLNAILPGDIAIKMIHPVPANSHCRFDAVSRYYGYYVYAQKNPFLLHRAYYFPYSIDLQLMEQAAKIISDYKDFSSFSKRRTQVNTFQCSIQLSEWKMDNDCMVYHVKANRFLRGMVRGLVGTMLQLGRGKITLEKFRNIIEAKDCSQADFAVPGHGLFLIAIQFPPGILL